MEYDYVLVGGGLQSGLVVLAVRHFRPYARVAVVERTDRLGGNHTWSFHAADLPPAAAPVVAPLTPASWPGYRVRFPGHHRTVRTAYHSFRSDRFDAVLRAALAAPGCALLLGAEATEVTAARVRLADGRALLGRCVIDSRGSAVAPGGGCGYQKFLGLEVETDRPWSDRLPTVMDATVWQDDGYRFVYVLPFAPTRVLVEDTYFSDSPAADTGRMRARIGEYIAARGVREWRVVREEEGVLPMPWTAGPNPPSPVIRGGYAGGWFHPATGYSFPAAVRLAVAVARVRPEEAGRAAAELAARLRPRQAFARLLNRLLFRAVRPDARWQVFRRLYRALPDATLARFYALEFTPFDAARVLVGRPPALDLARVFGRTEGFKCRSLPQ